MNYQQQGSVGRRAASHGKRGARRPRRRARRQRGLGDPLPLARDVVQWARETSPVLLMRKKASAKQPQDLDNEDDWECEEWVAQGDGTFVLSYRPESDLPALKHMSSMLDGLAMDEEVIDSQTTVPISDINMMPVDKERRPEQAPTSTKRPRTGAPSALGQRQSGK